MFVVSRCDVVTLAAGVVALVVIAFCLGHQHGMVLADNWQRRYEVERKRADECIVLAPPVCYDRWHRVAVPTCDGGTQTLVETDE